MKDKIIHATFSLDEDSVLNLVSEALAQGFEPIELLDCVQKGVEKVGESYEKGEYFIADLIMSGLIFNEVLSVLKFPQDTSPSSPGISRGIKIIFATAQTDIHDIGKNINVNYLRSRGLSVMDLGVNCPPEKIVEAIDPNVNNIVCLSCLMSSAYEPMKKTVDLIVENGLKNITTVLIGGRVSEEIRKYIGADYFAKDILTTYEVCSSAIAQNKNQV